MLSAEGTYEKLLDMYGKPQWWSDDPYQVMFQAVLVQNTTWSSVLKVTSSIRDHLEPRCIASLSPNELEELIRPCGFAKAKAGTILRLTDWYAGYGYDADTAACTEDSRLRKELLAIKGIGPETADVLMVYAFHKASFIIDTYTRRFLKRMGYGFTDDRQIRSFFEKGISKDYLVFGWLHWLILDHGIKYCGKNPKCDKCRLFECPENKCESC